MREMMRVLIGYDGSTVSDAVLEDLKNAGLPQRLDAIVLTAADLPFSKCLTLAPEQHPQATEPLTQSDKVVMARASSHADRAAQRLRRMFPLWSVRSEARAGSPAWTLITMAKEWKAHLIVVGAHGHCEIRRFIGSVSQIVLMNAPCSVRVARIPLPRLARRNLRILVAVDGSLDAEKAVNVVRGREWMAPISIRIISTVHSQVTLPVSPLVTAGIKLPHHSAISLERESVIEMVDLLARGLQSQNRQAEGYVREGDPKKITLTEARSWNADCIFMGARGTNTFRGFLLGSVSMAVAARADCSVEIVRGS